MKVNDTESKAKNPMTVVTIAIEDAAVPAMPITHYLLPPVPDTAADLAAMRVLEIKRFLVMFGVPFDDQGFDSQDLLGATARGLVVQEMGKDDVVRNRLKLPRLR